MDLHPATWIGALTRSRRGRIAIVATALALAGGGAALATVTAGSSVPGAYGVIDACVRNHSGVVRIVDPALGESCRRNESPFSWSENYAQEVRRHVGPTAVTDTAFTPVVASSLLGGGEPIYYVVTAKTVISTGNAAVSDCKLTVDRDGVPETTVDETSVGDVVVATHNLQAVVQLGGGGFNARLQCRADAAWSAADSSVIGMKIAVPATIVVTDAEPVSP